jgi:hypothetical protein
MIGRERCLGGPSLAHHVGGEARDHEGALETFLWRRSYTTNVQ